MSIFDNEEGLRRLEHVADGKPIPKDEDHVKAWDRPLTISVPQDPRGAFRKNMTAEIWKLVAHVRRHTPSEEMRVLAAGVEACIEEMVKLTTKPIEPEPSPYCQSLKDAVSEIEERDEF